MEVNFTKRESEVVDAISRGYNSREISDLLTISVHTVETHRKNVLKKLNARNMAHMVRKSIEKGLLVPNLTSYSNSMNVLN